MIHQIWNDRNVPEKWKASIKSCQRKNPEYEYRLWTLEEVEDLVRREYPWFYSTYSGRDPLYLYTGLAGGGGVPVLTVDL